MNGGIQEVDGSIPFSSTNPSRLLARDLAPPPALGSASPPRPLA
jgi:hypothetical protein